MHTRGGELFGRKVEKELDDLVMVLLLPVKASPMDARFEVCRSIIN